MGNDANTKVMMVMLLAMYLWCELGRGVMLIYFILFVVNIRAQTTRRKRDKTAITLLMIIPVPNVVVLRGTQ